MKTIKSSNTLKYIFVVIPLLTIQNLLIFWNHYFHNFSFPLDFVGTYFSFVAYWTTLASKGLYPAWNPFYSQGMPFDLLLQTGSHYPTLWIFPLLKIQYTLHSATVFQILHIFAGSIGMLLFLRLFFLQDNYGWVYALFGSVAFQFFGGFYSNAQHVDIIRVFAMAPFIMRK